MADDDGSSLSRRLHWDDDRGTPADSDIGADGWDERADRSAAGPEPRGSCIRHRASRKVFWWENPNLFIWNFDWAVIPEPAQRGEGISAELEGARPGEEEKQRAAPGSELQPRTVSEFSRRHRMLSALERY